MATDYDAPRKSEDDTESLEVLKERVPATMTSTVDSEDGDGVSFELPSEILTDVDDVLVLPPQADEFTCMHCFLVKHRAQFVREDKFGPVCVDCA